MEFALTNLPNLLKVMVFIYNLAQMYALEKWEQIQQFSFKNKNNRKQLHDGTIFLNLSMKLA